jgi:signal peptidase
MITITTARSTPFRHLKGTDRGWPSHVRSALTSMVVSSCTMLMLLITVPSAWGWSSYTVVSDSMAPLLRRGDVVVAAPGGSRDLRLGTVVVVAPEGGRNDAAGTTSIPITHRIVERLPDGRYRIKGDANPGPDSRLVAQRDVLGTLRLAVPVAGWPALLAQGGLPDVPGGTWVLLAGAVLLGGLLIVARRRGGKGAHRRPGVSRDPLLVGTTAVLVLAGSPLTASVMIRSTSTETNSFGSRAEFYAQAVMTLGPVSYWRMGDSTGTTTLTDAMGTVAMTRSGDVAPGQTPGAIANDTNKAMRFGTSGNAAVASTGASPPAALAISGPLTAAAWFKAPTTTQINNARLVTKWNGSAINYFLAFSGGTTRMRFLVETTTAGQRTTAMSPLAYNDNRWHFAVGVYDGTRVKLYMDGTMVLSTPLVGTAPLHTAAVEPVTISYSASPLAGVQVDEVAIWSTALTAVQISHLYSLATT